jgi:hypothetical protein
LHTYSFFSPDNWYDPQQSFNPIGIQNEKPLSSQIPRQTHPHWGLSANLSNPEKYFPGSRVVQSIQG